MKSLDKFVEIVDHYGNSIRKSICDHHSKIFRAGIIVFGLSLIGFSQMFPILIEHEYEAKKLTLQIEIQESKTIDNIHCEGLISNQNVCELAKYKNKVVITSIEALIKYMRLFAYSGVALMGLASFGFLGNIWDTRPDK